MPTQLVTDHIDTVQIGVFTFDVAISKRKAGTTPLFNSLNQLQPSSAFLDTGLTSSASQPVPFSSLVSKAQVTWGLNSNPLVRLVFGPSAEDFGSYVDFPGFSKNSVIGLRFRKEQLGQSSTWVYGVSQYSMPRIDDKRRTILVEGYGLLFEAARRQVSRSYKNTTAKNIIGVIASKYNLSLQTVGPLTDMVVAEDEQNVDDLGYISQLASLLNAFWYIEENRLVLIARDYMYSQKPVMTLITSLPSPNAQINFHSQFPISEFIPIASAQSFEAGAIQITARGIDLDSGEVVEKVFKPEATRLGSLSLTSDQFLSDEGVTVNDIVVKPAPKLTPIESGLFLPLRTRTDDEFRYRYAVEQKDFEIRALASMVGLPGVKPGQLINVQGVGELLSGNYVIWEVDHKIGDGNTYTTTLELVRNALGQSNVALPFKSNLQPTPNRVDDGVRVYAEAVE
jgi:hypothetical protein